MILITIPLARCIAFDVCLVEAEGRLVPAEVATWAHSIMDAWADELGRVPEAKDADAQGG